VVLGADVVYKESSVAPLLCVLRRLKPSRVLLANEVRSGNQRRFARTLAACGFDVKTTSLSPTTELLDARPAEKLTDFRLDSPAVLFGGEIVVDQDPQGADGLGGLVWPGAVALAAFATTKGASRVKGKRVLDLGAGTGAVGLAVAEEASFVCLTDEFLALAAHNADRNARGNIPVILRRGRWADDLDDDLQDLHFDVVLGAELTPMVAGHDALATDIRRRLRRTNGAVAYLTAAPCLRDDKKKNDDDDDDDKKKVTCCPCATHRFLRTALHRGLVLRHLHADVPLLDAPGVDRTLDDGHDTIWVLEFGVSPPAGE